MKNLERFGARNTQMAVADPAGNDNPRLAIDDEAVSGLAAQMLVLSEKRDLGAETRGGSAIPAGESQFKRPSLWQDNVGASFGAVAFLRERFSWVTILWRQPRLRESDIRGEGR